MKPKEITEEKERRKWCKDRSQYDGGVFRCDVVFTLIAFADEDTTGEEHKIAWYYCLAAGGSGARHTVQVSQPRKDFLCCCKRKTITCN